MLSRDETRAAERAAGVSQSERFALELEFVMSLANPRYIHRACPGHTNQPPRESMFSTLNVESSSDPPIFHASSAPPDVPFRIPYQTQTSRPPACWRTRRS